ncbi:hypothetical protein BCR42DRAFT_392461 [Absidia repens]|uniref:Uncharacterized protein n=1 Tax=Absidia repens TaxID=90262 RepID=A0A1X2IHE7_9FUNG|nr:hypothetical protein BCR42DRAFT_392461 [Absidia repens]
MTLQFIDKKGSTIIGTSSTKVTMVLSIHFTGSDALLFIHLHWSGFCLRLYLDINNDHMVPSNQSMKFWMDGLSVSFRWKRHLVYPSWYSVFVVRGKINQLKTSSSAIVNQINPITQPMVSWLRLWKKMSFFIIENYGSSALWNDYGDKVRNPSP